LFLKAIWNREVRGKDRVKERRGREMESGRVRGKEGVEVDVKTQFCYKSLHYFQVIVLIESPDIVERNKWYNQK